jgi:DNA invertase Pin-like site-specific DNA recombinase
MAVYAYLRVSTDRQDMDIQPYSILEYANTHGLALLHCVEDTVSGRLSWRRRAIGHLLTMTARAGDVILFAEVSRRARSPAATSGRGGAQPRETVRDRLIRIPG